MEAMYFFDTSGAPLYFSLLYEAVTSAISALERQNYGIALDTLRQGEEMARHTYLATTDTAHDTRQDV